MTLKRQRFEENPDDNTRAIRRKLETEHDNPLYSTHDQAVDELDVLDSEERDPNSIIVHDHDGSGLEQPSSGTLRLISSKCVTLPTKSTNY
jgi:hypothetical protein